MLSDSGCVFCPTALKLSHVKAVTQKWQVIVPTVKDLCMLKCWLLQIQYFLNNLFYIFQVVQIVHLVLIVRKIVDTV
jgi:hypothetical protein